MRQIASASAGLWSLVAASLQRVALYPLPVPPIKSRASNGQRRCQGAPHYTRSPATPLLSADFSPCRACRWLSPLSKRALPGASQKKKGAAAPFLSLMRPVSLSTTASAYRIRSCKSSRSARLVSGRTRRTYPYPLLPGQSPSASSLQQAANRQTRSMDWWAS